MGGLGRGALLLLWLVAGLCGAGRAEDGGEDDDGADTEAVVTAPGAAARAAETAEYIPVGREDIEVAVRRGAGYIVANCDEFGRFAYVRFPRAGTGQKRGYNLLRHCGTVYSLGMARAWRDAQEVDGTIRRAVRFLWDNGFIAGVPGQEGMLAIWDIPQKLGLAGGGGARIIAKLGGAGLGLLALAEDRRAGGETTLEQMQALGRFVLFMQREDGGFHSRYLPDTGYDTEFVSLYYPGEAILGLLRLYGLDGDRRWLEAAGRGLHYLASTRKESGEYPEDHWVLIASAEYLRYLPDYADSPVTHAQIIEHATGICRVMLRQQIVRGELAEFGSFRAGGQTCPTATRVEGMLAALEIIPQEQRPLRDLIMLACRRAAEFLVRAQIRDGELAGGMPRGTFVLPEISQEFIISNARLDEVRIDYVQHALSALIMYLAIAEDTP